MKRGRKMQSEAKQKIFLLFGVWIRWEEREEKGRERKKILREKREKREGQGMEKGGAEKGRRGMSEFSASREKKEVGTTGSQLGPGGWWWVLGQPHSRHRHTRYEDSYGTRYPYGACAIRRYRGSQGKARTSILPSRGGGSAGPDRSMGGSYDGCSGQESARELRRAASWRRLFPFLPGKVSTVLCRGISTGHKPRQNLVGQRKINNELMGADRTYIAGPHGLVGCCQVGDPNREGRRARLDAEEKRTM